MANNEFIELQNRVQELEKDNQKMKIFIRSFLGSDRYMVQKHLQMFDGRNVQTGLTTGTKFPSASAQKWAAWGVTPVDQPETVSDPTIVTVTTGGGNLTTNSTINSNFAALETAIEALIDRLQESGLLKI